MREAAIDAAKAKEPDMVHARLLFALVDTVAPDYLAAALPVPMMMPLYA